MMSDLLQQAQGQSSYSQAIRRDLHRHPELGFNEIRTAGIIAKELGEIGLDVRTGVGKTGVIGLLRGGQPGPTLLVRADIDALPIQEDSNAEYCSTNPGVMHACGHDGHVAIGLTVAKLLAAKRSDLKGNVKFMFQPAEEGLGGALSMLADGLLENPKVDACLALHLWSDAQLGWIGVSPGPVMASAAGFWVRITGKGGHGAQPHTTLDPVLAGAQVVTALQSVVSRNVGPLDSAVVTVAQFHAGDVGNVIPQTAVLNGTIRTFEPAVKARVFQRVKEIAEGITQAMGCQAEVSLIEGTHAVINDPEMTAHVAKVARRVFPDAIIATDYRTMGSEDMAMVMEKVPGCYFFVGAGNTEKGIVYGHHHPRFDIDEQVLPMGAALMAEAVLDYLS